MDKPMTRREYNLSKGIRVMVDAGSLDLPVDQEWIEFIDLILETLDKEQNSNSNSK